MGPYTFNINAAKILKFSVGNSILIYNHKIRLAMVSHLECASFPGFLLDKSTPQLPLEILKHISNKYFWSVLKSISFLKKR